MGKYYNQDKEEVLRIFQVDYQGLKENQVKEHQKKYGKNQLIQKEKPSKARIFLEQFQDLLVIILIIAAIISLFTGELESTIVIFAVISLNAIIGTYQHFKAEKSLESLKQLSSPFARVVRQSKEIVIPTSEVVVGDIVVLKAGDIVAADGRIIYAHSLEVNESSLTGESHSVEKGEGVLNKDDVPLAEQKNMVFSGTFVTSGKALMVVTKVGLESELGKIATLLAQTKSQKTPLQNALDDFSRKLAILIISICLAVFFLSLYRKITLLDSLLFAVALAVAAIPEALSSIVTIVLAIGTQRMAAKNAIVKELKAVEGLGCINVICSDKTGTLTQNQMDVQGIYLNGKEELKLDLNNKFDQYFLMTCYLCNDSVLTADENKNSTEAALLEYAKRYGINLYHELEKYPRLAEIPFDSNRKMMSTLNKVEYQHILFLKGGSDVILNKCSRLYSGGKIRFLCDADYYDINIRIREFAGNGCRTLGLAYKEYRLDKEEISFEDEKDLVFLGLIAMVDPPRPEAKEAITSVQKAGIRPVMITGDHPDTALAIAKRVGFSNLNIMTGNELDQISDRELRKRVENLSVFARVSPEHKIRIVKAWQEKNYILAFAGDGINDAPAIRQADIGIAMGEGTEVSKEAASIILTDNNYHTIVGAIKNGRKIYNNIQNAITFLISGNAAAIFLVIYTSLLLLPIPFAPVHLLFINLLTDSLPAIAIGLEDNEEDLLNRPPRKINSGLLSTRVLKIILFEGVLIALFTIIAFHIGLETDHYLARTMVFGTLCMARLFHSFNCRGTKSIFRNKVKNKTMIISFFLGMILINLVLFLKPLQPIFHVSTLSFWKGFWMYILAFLPTLIIQIILIYRNRRK